MAHQHEAKNIKYYRSASEIFRLTDWKSSQQIQGQR